MLYYYRRVIPKLNDDFQETGISKNRKIKVLDNLLLAVVEIA